MHYRLYFVIRLATSHFNMLFIHLFSTKQVHTPVNVHAQTREPTVHTQAIHALCTH